MKRFLPIIILITFFISSALHILPTQAQEFGEACRNNVVPFVEREEEVFFQQMNQHFQNRSDNSNLIGLAMELLQAHRQKLTRQLETHNVPEANRPIVDQQKELFACEQFVKEHLLTAQDALKRHIVGTSQAKKTTRLMEKYKAINTKLRKFNGEVGELLGYLKAMQNLGNSECFYLRSCVGR